MEFQRLNGITNVVSTTSIRLRNNTDNPTGNTFATYANPTALNVGFTLSNQQYTQANFTGYNGAVFIGYPTEPILTLMNAFGGAVNSSFTSNGASVGNGIDIAANRAVNFFTNVQPLTAAARATNQRWQMADLTLTFSRPVNNPYLQINALGGISGVSYSTEFDYLSSNVPVTFSKVSGTTFLNVTSTQILNSATTPDGAAANASRGTVLVSGTGITTLTLRVYVRGAAANTGTNWHAGANTAGEGYMIGATVTESNLAVTKTVSTTAPVAGSNVNFVITASNTGASNEANAIVNDLLPSGYTFVSSTASAGSYNSGTGVWTVGNLASGASATLNIVATVKSTGSYINTATIAGDNGDPDTTNNTATVNTVSPIITNTDGDGLADIDDLDDDNDGILDMVECNSTERVTSGGFNGLGNNVNITSVTGWTLSAGQVFSDSNTSIQFVTDNTSQTLSQAVSNIKFTGTSPVINIRVQNRDNISNIINSGITLAVNYAGTNYVLMTTNNANGPGTIAANNGASISTTILNSYNNGSAIGTYTDLAITLPSTVPASGTLALVYTSGNGNDDDIHVDNISIQSCRDLDGDGTPDYLDLDSDGDGCFDSLEGDENVTLAQINANGSINSAVDAQGLPVLVNSGGAADIGGDQGQGIGTSTNINVQDVQCAIGCTSNMYLSQGTPTTLYNINTATNPFTYPAIGTDAGFTYNGMGINPLDGFIYTIRDGTNNLIRINYNGTTVNLGAVTGLPSGSYNAGEIDNLGNYYVKNASGGNTLYKINLTALTATATTLSASMNISDFAYNVSNGLLYGVNSANGRLVSVDPVTGTITSIGATYATTDFGGMFYSSTGHVYGALNGGGFYQFNTTTGQRVLISGSPASGNNDGAHCVTAPITFSADLSVTKTDGVTTYAAGNTTTYTVVVNNTGPFGVLGATVSDPVPSGIPAANVSYTATVAGGASTTVTGTQTGAINDTVDLPVGATVTYTIVVTVPYGYSGNLVNTATVTTPSNITDTNTANNTATDTDTPALGFGCTTNMYLSQTNTLYNIGTATNPFTYTQIGSPAAVNYNAIGINPLNGFMYGIPPNTNTVIRINADGTYFDMGAVTGLPSGVIYNSGEIDNSGNYYVKVNTNNNQLYRVNLTTMTATLITLSASNNLPDIAYNIVTGLLYGVNSANGQLVSINPGTGAVTAIGSAPGAVNFGAMFGSSTGQMYGVDNTGGFYQFNLSNGQRVLISSAPASSANDGAHCVTAPIAFSADLSVTKTNGVTTYAPGTTTTYTVVVNNTGPFGVLGATVSDPVPAGIPPANVSYTAAVAGSATTTVVGTQTGDINDVINIPVGGSVTYTITVAIPFAYSGNLVNTATVTAPSNITDTNTANNSATDTDIQAVCYRPAVTAGTVLDTPYGITSLGRAGVTNSNWPMVRKGAWTALEAKTKGFVVNRLTTAQIAAIPSGDLVEGMMVYNITLDCLQVNTTGTPAGWSCFNTQTCP